MDNESKEIVRDLAFLHGLFLIFFVFFSLCAVFFAASFVTEVEAFNECHGVEDSKFKECYESKR